jgi:methyl-branched lipid omega-hydroxylase
MSTSVNDLDLNTVDLTNLDLFAEGPPHELFARMRAEAPVRWNPTADGGGFWSVTKAADIATISRDPGTFSSAREGFMINPDVPLPLEVMKIIMLGMDPPEHTKYRQIVQMAFTPRRINALEQAIRERVIRLLDAAFERGEFDFVTDVAVEIPLQTIAEMLGVLQDDRMKLFDWTMRLEEAVNEGSVEKGMAAFGEIGQYLAALVSDRRANPTDDLVTAMIEAEVDGEKLDDLQLTGFFAILMFAGNDTTRNTSSGGLLALIERPDERRKLVEDPQKIPGAAEEMVRWVTPVMHFRRTATTDTELRGTAIKEGDPVVIWYTSGSRDEKLVPDPMTFDVTREKLEHQAFGGGGRHHCLGAALARLQLRILFEELFKRPALELAGTPVRGSSNWVNGLTSLPVRVAE